MFKSFKKKSTKAKVGIIAFIVFMVVLVGFVLYSNFKPDPPKEYEIVDVAYGTITDTLDVSGTVVSGVTESFTAIEGVTVEEVLVSVGDRVEKGDKLASFNTSGVKKYLTDAQKDYNEALNDYNEAKQSANETANKKAELSKDIEAKEKEIADLEKQIAELESEIEAGEGTTATQPVPQEQIDAIVSQMQQNGATQDQIDQFVTAAGSTQIPTSGVDTEKTQLLTEMNVELAQKTAELSSLQAENATLFETDTSMLEALKTVVDTQKANYESVKAVYDSMNNGWYAKNTGIVTAVNIKAGEQFTAPASSSGSFDMSQLLNMASSSTIVDWSSLLGSTQSTPTGVGITLESYEDMLVSVTVGKADLLKIKVGMSATVVSLNSEYEGEVVYVGATAVSDSSGIDLGSLIGTTGGAAGAEVRVKIKNPDEKVVIGFDVDIKIQLSTTDDVLKIPVECVMYNDGVYTVFVYDSAEGTVAKRVVEKGTLDDTSYEIVSGLKEGEQVVKSPDPNMEDGTKVAKK